MTISTQTKNKNLDSINVYPLKVLKVTASAFCKIFGIDNWAIIMLGGWVLMCGVQLRRCCGRWDSVDGGDTLLLLPAAASSQHISSPRPPTHQPLAAEAGPTAGARRQGSSNRWLKCLILALTFNKIIPYCFILKHFLMTLSHWWNDCMFYHLFPGLVFKMEVMYWWKRRV